MDTEVYKAAAEGNIQFLKTYSEPEIGRFRSPAKNTILHLYIIAQSKRKHPLLQLPLGKFLTKFTSRRDRTSALCQLIINCARLFLGLPGPDLKETTVLSMLDMCPSLLWEVNDTGDTPVHMAARHGHADIAKVLIDRAKSSRQDVETAFEPVEAARRMLHATNAGGETALHQAVRYQHREVVDVIIGEDDAEFCYSANADGETPLYMAAERGSDELVKMILGAYASPAYQGPDGRTAFHAAILHSRTKTHQRMDMYYSNLTLPIAQILMTYYFLASLTLRVLCSFLLKSVISKPQGTNLTAAEAIMKKTGLEFLSTKTDDRGRTPLHYKPSLLKHDKSGAFIIDNDGNTALHIVASKGDSSSVKRFIKECPQCFEVVDGQGRNALHLAVESADEHTVNLILASRYLCELLKMKDNNGNTPLHLLAASQNHHMTPKYMERVTEDPRFDKMAFNKHNLNPLDVILTSNYTRSNEKRILKLCMMKAGIYRGQRVIIGSSIMNEEENDNNTAGTGKESGDDDLKEDRHNHLVVAALIATVTFAAGFTMPGGYIQEEGPELGYVVLSKSAAFKAFVVTDAFAMVFSSAAVFIHLLIAMDKGKKQVSELFSMALPLTLVAIVAMVIAFVTGTYAVLAHSPSLAITASVVGCVFFFLFAYFARKVFFSSIVIFLMVLEGLLQRIYGFIFGLIQRIQGFLYGLLRGGARRSAVVAVN